MFLLVCAVLNEIVALFAVPTSYYKMWSVLCILKKDSLRRKLQEQIFIDLQGEESETVFKRTKTWQTHEGAIRMLQLRDLCNQCVRSSQF